VPKRWDDGAREGELTATWATLKGRFDGQKGKGYGHRDQHDRCKGRFTWHKTRDDWKNPQKANE